MLGSSVQAMEGNPTYGVKLCGREFIRAVIFTCGGSRWRRAARGAGGSVCLILLLSLYPFSEILVIYCAIFMSFYLPVYLYFG